MNPARSLGPALVVGGTALAPGLAVLIVPSLAGACAGLRFWQHARDEALAPQTP